MISGVNPISHLIFGTNLKGQTFALHGQSLSHLELTEDALSSQIGGSGYITAKRFTQTQLHEFAKNGNPDEVTTQAKQKTWMGKIFFMCLNLTKHDTGNTPFV